MIRSKEFCVGIAEFDDVEGPLISHTIPPDFPLDIESNFEIADYALYVEGKTLFETDEFLVLSYPFKIYDESYDRKFKKYSIVVIARSTTAKKKLRELQEAVENVIRRVIDNVRLSMLKSKRYEVFLANLYDLVHEELYRGSSERPPSVRMIHQGDAMAPADLPLVLIDLRMKLAICSSTDVLETLRMQPQNFEAIVSSHKKIIAFVHKRIIEEKPELYHIILRRILLLEEEKKMALSLVDLLEGVSSS